MNILGLGLLLLQVQLGAANGLVTKPGGNEPLRKATVTLTPVAQGQNSQMRSAVTEEDGRFAIRDIKPGDYRLTSESDRYGQAAYGQRKPGGPGSILSIGAGQQLSDLRISMIPTGTIAGRITGRSGEPLVSATVQAFKYSYQDGKKALIAAQTTTTDDRGEYRLFWLPAGQYYVAAATASNPAPPSPVLPLRPGASGPDLTSVAEIQFLMTRAYQPLGKTRLRILEDGTTQEEAWAPVYFPATTEARFAAAIDVAAGTTRNGIDIVIGPARVQSIRGRVVGFRQGGFPTVTLMLQDTGAPNLYMPGAVNSASTVDGSFAFTGVLPGDYLVAASDQIAGLVGPPLAIHVGEGDVENLIVGMGQPVTVAARILVEGSATDGGGVGPMTSILVTLRLTNLSGRAAVSLQAPLRTGSFALSNLAPGDYQLQVNAAGPPGTKPLYVKSARLGLTDVTGGVRVDANTTDRIEIVLTPDAGAVEGVANGSRGGPAANATVVLVPNIARKRSDLYKSSVTGTDGRFRFQDLTPGDYKLFAWDDVETGAWQDPDFIRNYESKGLLVHIAEKGKETVELNVIYNP